MMIGSALLSGRARSLRHSSMPERPGSIQSSTTRSGGASRSRMSASSPRADGLDLVAFGFEVVAQQQRQRLFVFDDQDACAHVSVLAPHDTAALAKAVVSPFGR